MSLTASDYGLQIGQALKAVARLHADTSKLLLDCDKHIGKRRRSVFGSFVTRDLTYNVKADFWMPEGVYRFYDAGSLMVDALTVTFFMPERSGDPEAVPQSILTVGRIQYADSARTKGGDVKSVCDPWDLWLAFFRGGSKPQFQTILEGADLADGRIAWACWIAVPLVSISYGLAIKGSARHSESLAGGLDADGGDQLTHGVHQGLSSGSVVGVGHPNSAPTFFEHQ